jgi:hypothetical protein
VQPTSYTWKVCLRLCGEEHEVRAVMDDMRSVGGCQLLGADAWHALLRVPSVGSRSSSQIGELMREMAAAGEPPTAAVWMALATSFSRPDEVRGVMAEMTAASCSLPVPAPVWNHLLQCCSGPDETRAVMQEMVSAGLRVSVEAWLALLKSYPGPQQKRAVLAEMKAAGGARVSVRAWNMLLHAYHDAAGKRGLADMRAAGVEPDLSSWAWLLKSVSSCAEARQLLAEMQSNKLVPDIACWNTGQ